MIRVTRLGGDEIVINAAMIEFVEATPDTLISLATGRKIMVRESIDEVIARVQVYHHRIGRPLTLPFTTGEDEENTR